MIKKLPDYSNHVASDKGVMFFSAGAPRDCELILGAGIQDILVSYFYLRKRKDVFMSEIIPAIEDKKGLFMTDSGGFSFISGDIKPEYYTEEFWKPYLNEYVQWVHDNHKSIYVCANLDLDAYLGREKILEWNEKYFRPLEKLTNVVYVAHRDWENVYADANGMKRLKEYCKLYDYVGVNKNYVETADKVYEIAKTTRTRIHGFAWTSIPTLRNFPMMSVDSTTWLGGVKYGTSYRYDGKNFRVQDYKHKYKRQIDKILCRTAGIDYDKLLAEDPTEVNKYNLLGWKGARREFLHAANVKLKNKPVLFYAKNK